MIGRMGEPDHVASKLAKLWLDYALHSRPDEDIDRGHPFWDVYYDFRDPLESGPPLPGVWWDFIVAAMEHEHSDAALATFAAGPLEDFLRLHGDSFIQRVEEETTRSPRFQRAVSGVWQNDITEDIWARVRSLKAAAAAARNALS